MPSDSSTTGYLTEDDLKDSPGVPTEARRKKGPVATIECMEDIPCNPCESSCNYDAIIVGDDITNLPHLYEDNCVACQTCVYICPGQAIFMVDESLPDGRATVMMPYEYRPLPGKEDIVTALDRAGREQAGYVGQHHGADKFRRCLRPVVCHLAGRPRPNP